MRLYKHLLIACAGSMLCASASAVDLGPGESKLTPGMSFGFGAHTLVASVSRSVVGVNALNQVVFTGVLDHAVYQHNTSSLLTFMYRYTNDSTSADAVIRMTTTNFSGWSTNVDWVTNGASGVAPHHANRSGDGATIGFNWVDQSIGGSGLILPGQSSWTVMIMTDATQYMLGTTSLINGGVDSVVTFAPVPEPGTLAVLGAGAALLARRRRKS
jgi:hypothetical protein